ncbi:MAG: hypothetical protein IKS51_07565 [Erysipelotrichaceae bacterium]|nr:hypothetical protein [Erysipelotrichaceae bacterium]
MKLNEKKLVDYLKNHAGENTTTYRLAMDSGALEGEWNDFETDEMIRKIAEENRFRLNNDHNYFKELGMPWHIDFFIQEYDKEKVIAEIMSEPRPQRRIAMIQNEYGIYDEEEDRLIELRYDLPDVLRDLYERDCNELDRLSEGGTIDID